MPVFTLDRIIVTENITIGEAGVHRSALSREASDHLPIWASLALPGESPPGKLRGCLMRGTIELDVGFGEPRGQRNPLPGCLRQALLALCAAQPISDRFHGCIIRGSQRHC